MREAEGRCRRAGDVAHLSTSLARSQAVPACAGSARLTLSMHQEGMAQAMRFAEACSSAVIFTIFGPELPMVCACV